MNCRICSSPAKKVGETLSYFNSVVKVYYCEFCDLKFVPIFSLAREIHNELYSLGDLGYHHDKTKDNLSLEELIYKDISFAAVAHNLPARRPLDVLDVGCGYGYLTNALNKMGLQAKGIDIAGQPIAYAKKIYGNHFEQKEVTDVKGSYDMIIGIEVIEHLSDPTGFIKKCAELLKPGGKLILTTPNKDFYNRNTVWMTNPCPIHLYWFGKKAMAVVAEKAGLEMKVLPHHEYLAKYDNVNLLVDWLRYRNQKSAIFKTEPATKWSRLKGILRFIALAGPVKGICNFLFSFRPVTRTLAVVMTKI